MMGLKYEFVLLDGSPESAPLERDESYYPITDSTEPERQGQRRGRRILWIRESGIPVLGK
jgi:hypothetical protein